MGLALFPAVVKAQATNSEIGSATEAMPSPLTVTEPASQTSSPKATQADTPTPTPTPNPSLAPKASAQPTAPAPSPSIQLRGPSSAEVNEALGVQLFGPGGGAALWQDKDTAIAKKLQCKTESRTPLESSFQYLSKNADGEILDAHDFAISMRGVDGKVADITILYANKGNLKDFASDLEKDLKARTHGGTSMQTKMAMQEGIRHDQDTLYQNLTRLFGAGKGAALGAPGLMQPGTRWDWNGTSFFLVSVRNEYTALKILPTAAFESGADRTALTKAREKIPSLVNRLPNGDVIITDIPMIDIGADRNSSAPAAMERLLRYYGIPADRRQIATAANSNSAKKIYSSISYGLSSYGVRLANVGGARIGDIRQYIDRGQPVIWEVKCNDLRTRLKERKAQRSSVTDWGDWNANGLRTARNTAQALLIPKPGQKALLTQTCLITGYNEATREIAVSNPWGPSYNDGWLTQEEASAINLSSGAAIVW